jgi:hypothetical protein
MLILFRQAVVSQVDRKGALPVGSSRAATILAVDLKIGRVCDRPANSAQPFALAALGARCRRSLGEAGTGFLKSNLQGPDQLDFSSSIERAIE